MSNIGLSVIIPSRNELFLNKTIVDVIEKAEGEIEVIVVLDGYDTTRIKDSRIKYIVLTAQTGLHKRHAINEAMKLVKYDHIMALDAHCLMAKGFDTVLIRDCEENWVMIPRKYVLDAENWKIKENGKPPVDYEYWMWQKMEKKVLGGYRWDSRTLERDSIKIDDIFDFQGSCYFMHKAWFKKLGLMRTEGFGGFTQDSSEISFFTLYNGGKVKVDKNTWYAHLYKGREYGRMYRFDSSEKDRGDLYAFDLFVNKHREEFIKVIERLMPIPKWPSDWCDRLPKI